MTVRSNHRRSLLCLLAVLALVASACGQTRESDEASDDAEVVDSNETDGGDSDTPATPLDPSDVAATITFVDGSTTELSAAQLDEFYEPVIADEGFVAAAYDGTPPAGLRATMLGDMVIGAVFNDLIDEFGVTVSDSDRDTADGLLEGSVASLFSDESDPAAAASERFESLTYLPFLATLQARQSALTDSFGGEPVEVPCSSHILLDTEEEANDVIALLDDGGDFAELAMEFSTGPSGPSGGDLGCTNPAGFVPEFAAAITDAEVDTIIGPVQTEFGFHVITVTGTEEQASGDASALFSSEIRSTLSQITVDIDPSIGQWDPNSGQVIPG